MNDTRSGKMTMNLRFVLTPVTVFLLAVLILLPATGYAAFAPSGIEIDNAATGNTPQAVPETLDALIVPTLDDTTGYIISGYVYTWNNSSVPLDDFALGIGDDQVPYSDPAIISTDPDEWFSGSDGLGWYLHVKTVYFSPAAGTRLSSDVVVGPYTFDNVPPVAAVSLDTSVAGQTENTASGSPVTLLVNGSAGDVRTVYVNTAELFSSAVAYDFSDPGARTLTCDVPGTGAKTLYAWFEDGVGNISDPVSLTLTVVAEKTTQPGSITLISPSGVTVQNGPVLSWYEDSASTWYKVFIQGADKSYKYTQWYEIEDSSAGFPETSCSEGICTAAVNDTLAAGDYTWWAMGWNAQKGDGEWSSGMDFTVHPGTPAGIELTAPSGQAAGAVTDFTWKHDPLSTWYYVFIQSTDKSYKYTQWYEIADDFAGFPEAACTGGTCTVILDTGLGSGTYTWWVKGWNDNGDGEWSDGMDFTVQEGTPDKILVTAPSGQTAGAVTDFTWKHDSAATWYYVFIQRTDKSYKYTQWYEIADSSAGFPEAACTGETCTVILDTGLGSGTYTWWVKGWNDNGDGPWSNGMPFSVD